MRLRMTLGDSHPSPLKSPTDTSRQLFAPAKFTALTTTFPCAPPRYQTWVVPGPLPVLLVAAGEQEGIRRLFALNGGGESQSAPFTRT